MIFNIVSFHSLYIIRKIANKDFDFEIIVLLTSAVAVVYLEFGNHFRRCAQKHPPTQMNDIHITEC